MGEDYGWRRPGHGQRKTLLCLRMSGCSYLLPSLSSLAWDVYDVFLRTFLRFLGLKISTSNFTSKVVVHCTWRSLTRLFTPRRAPMNICIYFITYRTGPLALSTDRPYRNTRKFQPLSA